MAIHTVQAENHFMIYEKNNNKKHAVSIFLINV